MSNHLSELTWARVEAGELSLGLRWHLLRCAQCRREQRRRGEEKARFDADPDQRGDLLALMRHAPPATVLSAGSRAARMLVPVAVAASVALVVLTPTADVLSEKGNDVFLLYVKRGDAVMPLGDTCQSGDAIRAKFDSKRPYLLVLGVDGAGTSQLLHPEGGAESVRINPGSQLTPGSWVLDATPGLEHFVALFSDVPLSEETAKEIVVRGAKVPVGTQRVEVTCEKAVRR